MYIIVIEIKFFLLFVLYIGNIIFKSFINLFVRKDYMFIIKLKNGYLWNFGIIKYFYLIV